MPEENTVSPLAPCPYLLVFSARRGTEGRRRQCHFVSYCGKRVGLTNGSFVLLLQLARARFETHAGYLGPLPQDGPEVFRLAIHRLRSQIRACLNPGDNLNLIQTGLTTEYRITLKASDIAVDESFKELPRSLVSNDLRDFLVEHCPEITLGNLAATTVKLQ